MATAAQDDGATPWTLRLAEAIAAHPAGAFPEATLAQGAAVLADTLAAIVAGAREPDVARLALRFRAVDGAASLLGTGLRARPDDAAFFHGVAGTAVEMDEGNYASGGHPAIHAVPAALATAEALDATGAQLLDAIIIGYEAGARIGRAMKARPALHAHGTWGTVGAAMATARLRKLDARLTHQALVIAASLATATSRTSALRGATVRNVYAGIASRNGLLACGLAEDGFTGEDDAPETAFGQVLGSAFDPQAAVEGWGAGWEIDRNFMKFSACCKETQGALEVLVDVLGGLPDGRLDPAIVERIEIDTFADAVVLSEAAPPTPLAARFSIPFTVATRIVRGRAFVDDFQADALADPAIRALASRVVLREDPALSALVPRDRRTRMTIALSDGRTLATEVSGSLGDFDRPYDRALLAKKYLRLVGGENEQGSHDRLLAIRTWPRVSALAGHFSVDEASS